MTDLRVLCVIYTFDFLKYFDVPLYYTRARQCYGTILPHSGNDHDSVLASSNLAICYC